LELILDVFWELPSSLPVTLVLNEADGALNDPDIIADVNTALLSNVVVLELKLALGAVNDPVILVFNANADKSWSPVLVPDIVPDIFDPMIVPVAFILPVVDNDPVISELPFDWKPRFIMNSFAMYSFLPYPKSIFI